MCSCVDALDIRKMTQNSPELQKVLKGPRNNGRKRKSSDYIHTGLDSPLGDEPNGSGESDQQCLSKQPSVLWGCGLCDLRRIASRFNAERHIW
jgi:hypothetical protein